MRNKIIVLLALRIKHVFEKNFVYVLLLLAEAMIGFVWINYGREFEIIVDFYNHDRYSKVPSLQRTLMLKKNLP